MAEPLIIIGTLMVVLSILGFAGAWPLIRGASWGLLSLGVVLLVFAWLV